MAIRTVDRESVRSWRPRSGGRLTTADGTTLTLRHDSDSLEEPWFTECRIRYSGNPAASEIGARAFETGPVGTVDGHVAVLLDGEYVAEYPGQGGTYLLAQNADRSAGIVAWQGRWHEAYCWVNVPDAAHGRMLAELDGLVFTDTPAGLRVRLPAGQSYQRIMATKHLPGVGFAQVTQTATSAGSLPTWSGHRVRAGEIWRQQSDADLPEPAVALVCASPSAVVTVHARDGGTDDSALRFLTALSAATWE